MLKTVISKLAVFLTTTFMAFVIFGLAHAYAAPGTVTIKYVKHGNGIDTVEAASIKGSDMADQTMASDSTATKLKRQNWIYKGHLFAGWTTDPAADAPVVYTDGADMSEYLHNIPDDEHQELTLYAAWIRSYTIRFDLGIKPSDPDKASVYGSPDYLDETKCYLDVEVPIPEPRTKTEILDIKIPSGLPYLIERVGRSSGGYIRKGYMFGGWQASLKAIDNETYPSAANLSSYSGLKVAVNATDYKKFNMICGSQSVPFEATSSDWTRETGNVIYMHPYWVPNTLSLKYYYNEGTCADGSISHLQKIKVTAGKTVSGKTEAKAYIWEPNDESQAIELNGYDFVGWSEEEVNPGQNPEILYYPGEEVIRKSDEEEKFTLYDSLKNGNKTRKLYAVWDELLYDIAYNGTQEGIDVTPTDVTYEKGIKRSDDITLPSSRYSATGYKFIGWTTDRSTGTIYSPGSVISVQSLINSGEISADGNIYSSETGNRVINFYAVWEAYSITTSSVIYKVEWEDNNNQDGLRPEYLPVVLNEVVNGKNVNSWSKTVRPKEDKIEFTDTPDQYLDKQTNSLVTPSYKLTAGSEPSGYSISISNPANKSTIGKIKLVHSPETTEAVIKVFFSDSGNQDGARPKVVTVTLEDSKGEKHKADININGDTTEYKFEGLPKYKDGSELKYKITVDTKTDGYNYQIKEDGLKFSVTGNYTAKKIDIKVNAKFSNDDNNSGNTRPDIVQAVLSGSNGSKTSVVLTKATNYSAVVQGLPGNKDGGKINYSLQVAGVDGYETTITGNQENGFMVEFNMGKKAKDTLVEEKYQKEQDIDGNKPKPAESEPVVLKNVSDITVTTIWNDEKADGIRPSNYIIALVGSDGTEQEMVLSDETGYKGTFEQVPDEDEEHKDIEYKLRVFEIEGYTSHVYKDKNDPTKFTVENFKPDISNSYVSKIKRPDYLDPAEIEDHETGQDVEPTKPDGYQDEYEDYTNTEYEDSSTGLGGIMPSVPTQLIILCGVALIVIAGAGFGLWYMKRKKR